MQCSPPAPSTAKPLLTVIIPTYNEADVITYTLDEVTRVLSEAGIDYEIVVVDDDSPDGTWRIVEEYATRNPRVRICRRRGIRGLSTAILDGLSIARGNYIVVMDADMQHHPRYIPALLRKARETGADIVVASRYSKGGAIVGWSRTRLIISKAATLMAKLLVEGARKTSDPMSGFFLVRREFVEAIKDKLRPRGYKVLLEILARRRDARVEEVPYTFYPRRAGRSKLGINEIVDFILHVLKLSTLVKFALVGASGTIVNLLVMYLLLYMVGLNKSISSLAGIEAGLLWNFVLNEIWTFETGFRGGWWERLLAYHASSAGSYFVIFGTMYVTSTYLGVNPLEGQLLGILLGFIVNYLASSRGVWRLGVGRGERPRGEVSKARGGH